MIADAWVTSEPWWQIRIPFRELTLKVHGLDEGIASRDSPHQVREQSDERHDNDEQCPSNDLPRLNVVTVSHEINESDNLKNDNNQRNRSCNPDHSGTSIESIPIRC